jgi:hypothetical protein
MSAFDPLRVFGVYFPAAPLCYATALWQPPYRPLKTLLNMEIAAHIRASPWHYPRSFRPTHDAMPSSSSICPPAARS